MSGREVWTMKCGVSSIQRHGGVCAAVLNRFNGMGVSGTNMESLEDTNEIVLAQNSSDLRIACTVTHHLV
jgi:hypothetical protein